MKEKERVCVRERIQTLEELVAPQRTKLHIQKKSKSPTPKNKNNKRSTVENVK
jgi:hypothetical protein